MQLPGASAKLQSRCVDFVVVFYLQLSEAWRSFIMLSFQMG